jgi:membrane-bound lytic murein transglycosylase A
MLKLLTLAACLHAQIYTTGSYTGPGLKLVPEAQLPVFEDTFKSRAGLVKAARNTKKYLEKIKKETPTKLFRIGDKDYGIQALLDSADAIVEVTKSTEGLNERVRRTFDVYQSVGGDGQGKVVFSSYYQPMLEASLKPTAVYKYPIYKKPADMVEVDLAAFDKKNGVDSLIGRLGKDGRVVPYFTRGEIDIKKSLAGKNLELAWLKDRFDILDMHIQGSAILKLMPAGKEMLAGYAATNARTYNSVGLTLVKAGIFSREEITHDKLRQYLRDNPTAENWILAQNPRFTFFTLKPLPEGGEPFGTVNESLTPSRSIAIDTAYIPLGAVTYFTTLSPQVDEKGGLLGIFPTARFAMAMDTGGAIKTPGRVDIYVGHGQQAAITARNQWAEGKLYVLIKKLPPRER